MPASKTKKGKKTHKGRSGGSSNTGQNNYSSKDVMTNRVPRNRHLIVAPTFRTKCTINFSGYITVNTMTHTYWTFGGNSLHNPFNTTLAASFQTVNTNLTPYITESYTTVQPQGFSSLCAATAPYSRYRVLSSNVKLIIAPCAILDPIFAVINTCTSGTNANTQLWTASAAPFSSKIRLFSTSAPNAQLTNRASTAEIYGVTPAAVRTESAYSAFYNTYPVNEWVWAVNICTASGANNAANVGVSIEVEYDCEFFDPDTGGLPDTLSVPTRDESESSNTSGCIDGVTDAECIGKWGEPAPTIDSSIAARMSNDQWFVRNQKLMELKIQADANKTSNIHTESQNIRQGMDQAQHDIYTRQIAALRAKKTVTNQNATGIS